MPLAVIPAPVIPGERSAGRGSTDIRGAMGSLPLQRLPPLPAGNDSLTVNGTSSSWPHLLRPSTSSTLATALALEKNRGWPDLVGP